MVFLVFASCRASAIPVRRSARNCGLLAAGVIAGGQTHQTGADVDIRSPRPPASGRRKISGILQRHARGRAGMRTDARDRRAFLHRAAVFRVRSDQDVRRSGPGRNPDRHVRGSDAGAAARYILLVRNESGICSGSQRSGFRRQRAAAFLRLDCRADGSHPGLYSLLSVVPSSCRSQPPGSTNGQRAAHRLPALRRNQPCAARTMRDGAKCGSCHRPLYEGRPAALDSVAQFDKHAKHSDIPLLVDFWAAWCGPGAGQWRRSSNRRQPNSSPTCG
jgi:hypothetical protein